MARGKNPSIFDSTFKSNSRDRKKTKNVSHEQFVNTIGGLNSEISNLSEAMKHQTMVHAQLYKSGVANISAISEHTDALQQEIKRIKTGAVEDVINIETGELSDSINKLNENTQNLANVGDKLEFATENLQASSEEFSSTTSSLEDSIGDLAKVNAESSEQLRYVSDGLKTVGKWGMMAALPAAGFAAGRLTAGVGRTAGRMATAPIRAAAKPIKYYTGAQTEATQEIVGDVRSDIGGSFKKGLGASSLMSMGGPAAMVMESLLFGGKKDESGGGGGGGQGITGAAWEGMKSLPGLITPLQSLTGWIKGFPKDTQTKGVFHISPPDGEEFEVAPSEEFKENIGSITNKVGETNDLLDSEKGKPLEVSPSDAFNKALSESIGTKGQGKVLSKSFTESLEEVGKTGSMFGLKSLFSPIFGLGTSLAFIVPGFGMGYRAEANRLINIKKQGMFGAIVSGLKLIYIHQRFASEEANQLSLQQARLLQLGFELPGTLWKPKARSLSEWLGKTIGSTIGEAIGGESSPLAYVKDMVTGKIKGFASGLFGKAKNALFGEEGKKTGSIFEKMLPGYGAWKESKAKQLEESELKKSPSLVKRIQLLTDIRDILDTRLLEPDKLKDLFFDIFKSGGAKVKGKKGIPNLQEAMEESKEVVEEGLVRVHPGETIGKAARFAKRKTTSAYESVKDKVTKAKSPDTETEQPKGGIFSKMFGGILNMFTGGIFKKMGDWLKKIWQGIIDLPQHIVSGIKDVWETWGNEFWGKIIDFSKEMISHPIEFAKTTWNTLIEKLKTLEILQPIRDLLGEIKTLYQKGSEYDITKGGMFALKKDKKSIFGGILSVLDKIGERIFSSVDSIISYMTKSLKKDLGEFAYSIGDVAAKAYQTLVPQVLKDVLTKMYESNKEAMMNLNKGVSSFIKGIILFSQAIKDYIMYIGKPMIDAWKKGDTIVDKIIKTIGSSFQSVVNIFSGLPDLFKELWNSIKLMGTSIFKIFSDWTGLQWSIGLQLKSYWLEVKKETMGKLLPETWSEIYKRIEDRLFEWSMASYKAFENIMGIGFEKASEAYKEVIKKETGLLGKPKGIFAGIRALIKEGIRPYTDLLKNMIGDLKYFVDTIKIYYNDFGKIISDFIELKDNIKSISIALKDMIKDFYEFSIGHQLKQKQIGTTPTMQDGGIITDEGVPIVAHEGEMVGTPKRIINWLSSALEKIGFGKKEDTVSMENFKFSVIDKLDTIIKLLQSGKGKQGPGILSKLLGGVIDIPLRAAKSLSGVIGDIIKAPFKLLNSTLSILTKTISSAANAALETYRFGIKTLRKTLEVGFATLKFTLQKGWSIITAPFKAIGRFILRPFKGIIEGIKSIKEKVTAKVKGVVTAVRRKIFGEDIVAVDPEGKPVFAKWPGKFIKQLKKFREEQYDIGYKIISLMKSGGTGEEEGEESTVSNKGILSTLKRIRFLAEEDQIASKKHSYFLRKIRQGTDAVKTGLKKMGSKVWSILLMGFGFLKSGIGKLTALLAPLGAMAGQLIGQGAAAIAGFIGPMIGPIMAVALAGAAGAAIGTLLNKFVVTPLMDKWYEKMDKKEAETRTKTGALSKKEIEVLQSEKSTAEEKTTAKAKLRTVSEGLSDIRHIERTDYGDVSKRGIPSIEEGQQLFMRENINDYLPYGPRQIGELRTDWLIGGGYRDKKFWGEDYIQYGQAREAAFLKYLQDKGEILSKEQFEKEIKEKPAYLGGKIPTEAAEQVKSEMGGIEGMGEAAKETSINTGAVDENTQVLKELTSAIRGESPIEMALGGIVTKPINALIGEAGPEAVIPLNQAGIKSIYLSDSDITNSLGNIGISERDNDILMSSKNMVESEVKKEMFKNEATAQKIMEGNSELADKMEQTQQTAINTINNFNTSMSSTMSNLGRSMENKPIETIDPNLVDILEGRLS